jgi:cytochrome P450
MTLYPEVQRKVQAEIDRVIGNARLPVYPDEDSLPYLQAMLKEVLRWHPVTPLGKFSSSYYITPLHYLAGVAHRATKSDVYEGHFIPAGSMIIPNVWFVPPYTSELFIQCPFSAMVSKGMLHDPEIFPAPDRFYPERWFSKSVPAFPTQAFGLGCVCVPVNSLLAGASGRIWLGCWLRSISHLRRTGPQRKNTHRG